ncbi:MAG: helix-turn-helix domain-containing protein [Myxococcota bacterium]|nr:helix-turn-helix domain-containing protein [Myxococcota bacterium]
MTPPSTQAPRRGRPSRRAEIFSAALRLFRERGFHATSINDIGAEAGVAGTAIYSHFRTKQQVLEEAIREGAGRIRSGMTAALSDKERSAEAALEDLVRAYVEVVLDNADMNACYVLEARNLDPDVRGPLVRGERGLRDVWRRQLMAVRPELSADQARTMVQMAIFAVVALCVHRHRIEHEQLVEQATSFVLGALRSPVPTTPH